VTSGLQVRHVTVRLPSHADYQGKQDKTQYVLNFL